MKNFRGKSLTKSLGILIASLSLTAVAGDNPVNCQNALAATNTYGGQSASCIADSPDAGKVRLNQYVPEQEGDSKTLVSYDYGEPVSCEAQLEPARTVQYNSLTCDYTPQAVYVSQYYPHPYYITTYSGYYSTDRDGTVVGWEWITNGSLINEGVNFMHMGLGSTPQSLKLRVTDNDGYKDTITIH